MKLKNLKASDLEALAPHIEPVIEKDGASETITGLIIRIGNRMLSIEKGEYYSRSLLIQERITHEEAQRWMLSGKLCGVAVKEIFETRGEAEDRLRAIHRDVSAEVAPLEVLEVNGYVDLETGDFVVRPSDENVFVAVELPF